MTTTDLPERIGDAERQDAIARLGSHWRAGRLNPSEHEARTTKAFHAVTRHDLDALFTDLPGDGSPQDTAAPAATAKATGLVPEGSWAHRRRDAIMGVLPFVALAIFFATGWHFWPVFLLIPAAGALLYSGEENRERRHRGHQGHRRSRCR